MRIETKQTFGRLWQLYQGWFHGHGVFSTMDGTKYEGGGGGVEVVEGEVEVGVDLVGEVWVADGVEQVREVGVEEIEVG